jgi:hypothetical protein
MRSPSPVLPSFVVIVIVFVVAKSSRFRFFPNDDSIDEDIEKRASIIERKRNTNVQHRAKQSTLIALLLLLMMMSIASLALLPNGSPNCDAHKLSGNKLHSEKRAYMLSSLSRSHPSKISHSYQQRRRKRTATVTQIMASGDVHNVKMGASAAERNAPHIAAKVVPRLLQICKEEEEENIDKEKYAFEIGSGQGVHASIIAPKLPNIEFVLSDMAEDYFEHIKENVKSIDNVLLPPVTFDARDDIVDALIVDNLKAVIGACLLVLVVNICHISPIETTKGIFASSEKVLAKRGVLYIYGPFNVDGKYTSEGNERFDKSMKEKDERFGIRDISELEAIGETHGMKLNEIHEMPANNFLLGWVRTR